MSINFAAISPHPPIIVPQVGGADLEKVSNTVLAMKKLATAFAKAEIETLVIISPHMLSYPDKFSICGMKKLFGTFAAFDHPDIIVEANNDLDFVAALEKSAISADIDHLIYDNAGEFFEMDHGLMVPMQYLSATSEFPFKVAPIAYSNLTRAKHFAFGQVIAEVCQKSPSRIGILASGDLSHQLLQNPNGKKFDSKFTSDLKINNTKDILYYDDSFVESAGECGFRSILILLGALDNIKTKPEVLSYEGPFGVGYLVLNYNLQEKR